MVGSMLMRLKFTLWMLTTLAPVASAAVINCSAGAASVPVFDPSSVSGAVGDYTLDCTGGTPVVPPMPVPPINVEAFMNVSVLTPGAWVFSAGSGACCFSSREYLRQSEWRSAGLSIQGRRRDIQQHFDHHPELRST